MTKTKPICHVAVHWIVGPAILVTGVKLMEDSEENE